MTDFDVEEDSTMYKFLAYSRPRRLTDPILQYLILPPRYRNLRRQGRLGILTVLVASILPPTGPCGAGDDLRLVICRGSISLGALDNAASCDITMILDKKISARREEVSRSAKVNHRWVRRNDCLAHDNQMTYGATQGYVSSH
jgi:hypothetical protein